MKNFTFSIIISSLLSFSAIADEGMWLPQLLKSMNIADMEAKGIKINAENLYNINNSSIKDAVVSLGGGSCTAEMISPNGLMLTNHHCALRSIQEHSSVTTNYLKDGFWAMNYEEELKNVGLTASFLIKIENVTKKIMSGVDSITSEKNRAFKISEISKKLFRKLQKVPITMQESSLFLVEMIFIC